MGTAKVLSFSVVKSVAVNDIANVMQLAFRHKALGNILCDAEIQILLTVKQDCVFLVLILEVDSVRQTLFCARFGV